MIYAYGAGSARYTESVPQIRTAAAHVEWVFEQSAAKTGGTRRVRWVTDADFRLVVNKVQLSAAAMG